MSDFRATEQVQKLSNLYSKQKELMLKRIVINRNDINPIGSLKIVDVTAIENKLLSSQIWKVSRSGELEAKIGEVSIVLDEQGVLRVATDYYSEFAYLNDPALRPMTEEQEKRIASIISGEGLPSPSGMMPPSEPAVNTEDEND